MKKIEITRSWRFGRTLYHTGFYRVPADLSDEIAARAVKENAGEFVIEPVRAPRQHRKTPAPENKAMTAQEDKEQSPFQPEED